MLNMYGLSTAIQQRSVNLIVKGRINRVYIFAIKFILSDIECLAETLEVYDFTLTQET